MEFNYPSNHLKIKKYSKKMNFLKFTVSLIIIIIIIIDDDVKNCQLGHSFNPKIWTILKDLQEKQS